MTVIRRYFNDLSDEELCNYVKSMDWNCKEFCPFHNDCKKENLNVKCINVIKKYGLKEVKE